LERGVPLGVVPLGTFNDLSRALGIPLDISQACRVIVDGHTKRIDVGHVNGRYFVNESSVGLSTRIARRQTPEVKRRFGVLGIITTTLQSIFETRPFSVQLKYDGTSERFRSVQLTIANNKHFGGVIESPDAAIDDGWLDLYSIEARTWWEFFALVRKIIVRDPSSGEGLRTRRSARFEVRTHHPHHIEADGEPAGFTPATFEVLPHILEVLVPSGIS
jgi:YegS/Rv2252/BmrU family lipid kinase